MDYATLFTNDLWEPEEGQKDPNKLKVTEKILKKLRNHYCQCIFCTLKGEDRKNEELIERVIMGYVANFDSTRLNIRSSYADYIHPFELFEIITKYAYIDLINFTYFPEKNNLPPFFIALLNNGFSQTEMDKILEKFTHKPSNDSNNDSDDLPF